MAEKKCLESVQILRGIAALAVVIHHACLMVLENGAKPALLNQFGYFTDLGASGVDIFFVISGFIMVFVSHQSFGRPNAASEFWLKRLVRIVPLYWIYTTIMLLLVLSPFAMKHAVFSLSYTVKSYLFIPAFIPGSTMSLPQPLLIPGWTLFYEMFFYLILGTWLRFGRLETLVPFVLCCFSLSLMASRVLGDGSAVGAFLGQPIMFEFLFGVIVGYAFVKGRHLSPRGSLACVWVAVAFFVLSIFARPALASRWIFWGLPSALLLYGAVGLSVGKGKLVSYLVGLGDSSYTLYLQHAFVILVVGGFLKRSILVHQLPPDLLIVLTVIGCTVLGWFSYLYLEKPMNTWLAKRFTTRPRQTPSVPESIASVKSAEIPSA
jgi:peptidoglycan/LPS O-acetylase OafA/YrhL